MSQSRFAVLMNNSNSNNSSNNNFSQKKHDDNNHNNNNYKNKTIRNNKTIIKNDKLQNNEKSMSNMEFPLLGKTTVSNNKENNKDSFANKLKTEIIVNEEKINIAPGWVRIEKDRNTNKIKYSEPLNKSLSELRVEDIEDTKDTELVMTKLTDLHKMRTNEYIEQWGKEEWENLFTFKNYTCCSDTESNPSLNGDY